VVVPQVPGLLFVLIGGTGLRGETFADHGFQASWYKVPGVFVEILSTPSHMVLINKGLSTVPMLKNVIVG